MLVAVHVLLLVAACAALLRPMLDKPFSEDDGNWFYLARFRHTGLRLFENYFNVHGYFGVAWTCAVLTAPFGRKTSRLFYGLKAVWYGLTVLAVYWLALAWWGEPWSALASAALLLLVMATPNTLFVCTYAEHFFLLPLTLSLLCIHYGQWAGAGLFVLAGVFSAWANQMKVTALAASLFFPALFLFRPGGLTHLPAYVGGYALLTLLPMLLIRSSSGWKRYLDTLYGPVASFLLPRWRTVWRRLGPCARQALDATCTVARSSLERARGTAAQRGERGEKEPEGTQCTNGARGTTGTNGARGTEGTKRHMAQGGPETTRPNRSATPAGNTDTAAPDAGDRVAAAGQHSEPWAAEASPMAARAKASDDILTKPIAQTEPISASSSEEAGRESTSAADVAAIADGDTGGTGTKDANLEAANLEDANMDAGGAEDGNTGKAGASDAGRGMSAPAPSARQRYTDRLHALASRARLQLLADNLLPMTSDLFLIPLLALCGVLFGPSTRLGATLFLAGLLLVTLVMQQAQQNYHTPHFNPMWLPLCLLAGRGAGVVAGWPLGAQLGVAALAAGQLWRSWRAIRPEFAPGAENRMGHVEHRLRMLFRFAEPVGEAIGEMAAPGDRLLVWGDQPSINLYSGLPSPDTGFLFVYAHFGQVVEPEPAMRSIRNNPPEYILLYNWRVQDDWDMDRIVRMTGIPYREVRRFTVPGEDGAPHVDEYGFVFDFPLYRRDDEAYRQILFDRAQVFHEQGGYMDARYNLLRVRAISPDDPEAKLKGARLERTYPFQPDFFTGEDPDPAPETLGRDGLFALCMATGGEALARQDGDAARQAFEQALKLRPMSPRALTGLGRAHVLGGNARQALPHFAKAHARNPLLPSLNNDMGAVLASMGSLDDARRHMQTAARHLPRFFMAENNLRELDKAVQGKPATLCDIRALQRAAAQNRELQYWNMFFPGRDRNTLKGRLATAGLNLGGRILEFDGSRGPWSLVLAEMNREVHSLSLNEHDLRNGQLLRKMLGTQAQHIHLWDGGATEFAEASFDGIFSHIAPSILDCRLLLDESARLLRPGGIVCFTALNTPLVWWITLLNAGMSLKVRPERKREVLKICARAIMHGGSDHAAPNRMTRRRCAKLCAASGLELVAYGGNGQLDLTGSGGQHPLTFGNPTPGANRLTVDFIARKPL